MTPKKLKRKETQLIYIYTINYKEKKSKERLPYPSSLALYDSEFDALPAKSFQSRRMSVSFFFANQLLRWAWYYDCRHTCIECLTNKLH